MKLKRYHKKVKVVQTVHLLIDNMTGGKQENDSGIKVTTPRIIVSSSVPRGCGLDCQVRKKLIETGVSPRLNSSLSSSSLSFFIHGKRSG